ncbi:MAG: prepilin-type N-terminal cleavage/methylation domain-containing protein [Phycisphaerales bacterium]|nr:prepilin-type N-terminal cleavage/methylation domain-containing protein [Phycisphaerales bacterium]
MARSTGTRAPAFSLVELVVVIVIIGILAAIAVPRLSRGSAGASQSAVSANLATVRAAIELYAAEHGGNYPGPDAAGFVSKLTMFTSYAGATSATKDTTHKFGPYLLAIPPCPVGENASKPSAANVLISATSPPTPDPSGGEGWVYNPNTGEFLPNTTQMDDSGNPFNGY